MRHETRHKNFNFILTILLFTQLILPVHAQGENKKTNPAFKDKATYVERDHIPYYGKNAVVDIYRADGMLYNVDTVTQEVVEIYPEAMVYQINGGYSEDQLRGMAETMVAGFLGSKVQLGKLSFSLDRKSGLFFFRWSDTSQKLYYGDYAFIQVGLSQNGDFLNFYNTLPFGQDGMAPLIGPFNQIYANGGAYWSGTGGWTVATGGWYYLHPSGCSGSFCSTFYYAGTNYGGGGLIYGYWWPNYNTNTKASVFITNTHATAYATYILYDNNYNYSSYTLNQQPWNNTFVSITPSVYQNGIHVVSLNNYGTPGYELDWDELWVYNP